MGISIAERPMGDWGPEFEKEYGGSVLVECTDSESWLREFHAWRPVDPQMELSDGFHRFPWNMPTPLPEYHRWSVTKYMGWTAYKQFLNV